MNTQDDTYWMQQALLCAKQAAEQDEVPVGAVLVDADHHCLGQGFNRVITDQDPTAHAEIVVLRQAARIQKNYRLLNTTLYVTLEPCTMCLGALVHARIQRLVFGAYDPKSGVIASTISLLDTAPFNHQFAWTGGVEATACSELLTHFFKKKR